MVMKRDRTRTRSTHGRLEAYGLGARPLPIDASVVPAADLRDDRLDAGVLSGGPTAWNGAVDYLRHHAMVCGDDREQVVETIKPFDRRRGADHAELDAVLAALDDGRPVAFYGWWPDAELASTTDTLGVDAIDVPPPDRKGTGLVDGHAVVIVGYARHAAFPGGGYLIVRNSWEGWGHDGHGYLPFTFVRAYATELCRLRAGGQVGTGPVGPHDVHCRVAPSQTALEADVSAQARCADPRSSLTHLFFSETPLELARARAICSSCPVRGACLNLALARREPYGVWGGEFLVDGVIVADKRGRGRPPKVARPRLVVDEITGVPIVA